MKLNKLPFSALLLIIALTASCNSSQGYNAEKDFKIFVLDDNTVKITDYKGKSKDVRIPPQIQEMPVTIIGTYSFSGDALTNVTIPNSVTEIDVFAFSGNKLTTVIIPDSVSIIGNYAFNGNKLTTINIPDSVSIIGDYAFYNNALTHVTIPSNVTEIGQEAFTKNKLTGVTIQEGVASIGASSFKDNKLTEVIIPNSITHIGYEAFEGNDNISRITIGDNININWVGFPAEFILFYEEAVRKKGGTYIYGDRWVFNWIPEDKSIPVFVFSSRHNKGKIINIDFLKDMPYLEEVYLYDENINNYEPLVSLQQLEILKINNNEDEIKKIDLSHIGQLHTLKILNIGGNVELINISALGNLVNLEELSIGGIGDLDISWMPGLHRLTKLELSCTINDISPLAALPNLLDVDLTNSDIKDIFPLLDSNSIKYIRVSNEVKTDISSALLSLFNWKGIELVTFRDTR